MLEYREITPEDIEELAALFVEAFHAPPWTEDWTKEAAAKRLHQMIHVEDFCGLCACENHEICGMILGCMEQYYNGTVFQIREFCIKNTQRGNGLGSKLFRKFEERLKEKGVTEINLVTRKGDLTEHFYEKQGVITYADMVIMGKKL